MTEPSAKYTIVPNPEPITALQSALDKLNDDSSKMVHLEPRQVKALRKHLDELKRENAELRACANIDEALRPADGDTKWTERFKGLYEGHYE